MFLPLDKKPDWKNPPLVTLILVIANVLIFYMLQFNDQRHERTAYEYYTTSGLDLIELKRYIKYKKLQKNVTEEDIERKSTKAGEAFVDMRLDGEFQNKLQNDEIITPADPEYSQWRIKRNKFQGYLDLSDSAKYSLNPSQPTLLTYFTSMFLHGDAGHLFGNMVMLVLLGLGVEVLLGRLLFLIGYLISGLAGNWLYVILDSEKFGYGLGASGAIAGVLGMAVMIYGFRKIYFFYFLFIYFDFIKARAIWIIPLYILSQAIIEFAFKTNINVAAHVGGFAGGLAFTAILKLIPNLIDKENINESQNKESFEKDYNAAQQLVASMKLEEARKKFETLLKQHPGDMNIQQQLFSIAKYNPASEDYHKYAQALLNTSGSDATTMKTVFETYRHYAAKAKPKPRWTPDLLVSLATRFAASGQLKDSEKIINHLIKVMPEFPRIAEGLSALVKYYNGVDAEKSTNYKARLIELYPDSVEASHTR